jgi:hypothetical protein
MATKPTSLPTWATTAGTTVEPSAGQKAAGWTAGTRPPARWMNWLLNVLYQWCAYLNDAKFGQQSVQILTASSGTYTTPADCRAIRVTCVAGGGGGGGVTDGTPVSIGSAGSSGGVSTKIICPVGASYAYTCGSGGSGGLGSGAGTGGAGGDTTFGSSAVVAKGGNPGSNATHAVNSIMFAAGANPPTTGAVGDVVSYGKHGGVGCGYYNADSGGIYSFVISGDGADSPFGVGGASAYLTNGNAGSGYGSGGSGGSAYSGSGSKTGGAGATGVVIVEEYY